MIIETKFCIAQSVLVEVAENLETATIKDINILIFKKFDAKITTIITYTININNGQSRVGEEYIHASREKYLEVVAARKQQRLLYLQAEIDKLL